MKPKHSHILAFGALSLVMPASADVIYSNLQNIAIPTTFDGVFLNVETGALSTPSNLGAGVSGWDVNVFNGGRAFANSPDFQPVRSGTGSSSPILNLTAGTLVNSSSVISTFVQGVGGETPGAAGYGGSQTLTGLGGNFTAATEGYLGFRLNGTNYGSMRVVFTNNAAGAMIKDWAYDTSGAPVVVGAIQQVGQDIVLSSGFTLASALNDSGGATNLVKNGSGTNILTAASNYTGTTSVNAGKLVVGVAGVGSIASHVTVASTAALGGSGTITGNVTLNAESASGFRDGGKLAPGNSPGVLTATGTTTFNTGSMFSWNIDTDVGGGLRGTEYSGLNTTSVSGSDAVFQIVTGDSQGFADPFWTTNQNWTDIFKDAGGTTSLTNDWSTVFSSFAYSDGTNPITDHATYGSFSWTNSGSTLSWTAVPEPTTALAGLLLGAGLLRRRRPVSQ